MRTIEPFQQTAARVAGILYLTTMATAVLGEVVVRDRLVVRGDALQTARNIAEAEWLYRLGLAFDLSTFAGVVALVWALHVALAPVGRSLARLAVFLRLVEASVASAGVVFSLVALRPLGTAAYLQAFDEQQLAVLTRFLIGAAGSAMQVAFVLLGLGSAVFAWLWFRSRYVPRAVAVLGIAASLLLSGGTLAIIVFPRLADVLGLGYMMPLGVFEVGLGLWLLVRGLRVPGEEPVPAPGRTPGLAAAVRA
jgi:hypothetical protein